MASHECKVLVIGAAPAGLTAGYILSKNKVPVTVIEQDSVYVGGISRTVNYKGFGIDIGGHRFFSKSDEIEALWDEILGADFLQRPRKSRIYYKHRFFDYPLKAMDSLSKLGIFESVLCMLSYMKARAAPYHNPKNFEEWVVNKFGQRLFNIFFKTYTEKVWGMSCKEISADWAAQRIKGLSLWVAVRNALFKKEAQTVVKTLIDSFRYPRKGPGMMWEKAAEKMIAQGGILNMGERLVGLSYDATKKLWDASIQRADGVHKQYLAEHVICSAPLREVVLGLKPAVSSAAKQAATNLKYRDFLIVALIVKDKQQFDDNWIYIHDPNVKVGRIQNFKSWSPEMIPSPDKNCFGMEYFCFENDGLWNSKDEELITSAKQELCALGLASMEDIIEGYVVRQPKAYPVYDDHYAKHVATVREELERNYPNLHLVGRNGMHKYNNQDHAMMTGMLTARNIMAGNDQYDVWRVNQDAEYHETITAEEGGRLLPRKVSK